MFVTETRILVYVAVVVLCLKVSWHFEVICDRSSLKWHVLQADVCTLPVSANSDTGWGIVGTDTDFHGTEWLYCADVPLSNYSLTMILIYCPEVRALAGPWKSLNFFSRFSRPGKSLKTDMVLESPWICVWRSLKVLEFEFLKRRDRTTVDAFGKLFW